MEAMSQPRRDAAAQLQDLIGFVQAAPSPFHAAEEVARRLVAAGARRVDGTRPLPTEPGGYVLVRDGAVAAWVLPDGAAGDGRPPALRIIGAHTDSPGFTLKPDPQDESAGYARARVEVYGGALLNSWLDREVEFAGRVADRRGGVHLVRTGPVARIPQLAIHLHREIGQEGLRLDRQRHTPPLLGIGGDLRGHLAAAAGIDRGDLAGWELITADTQPPRTVGLAGEFLASGRLDNLLSVHAALIALEDLLAAGGRPADRAGEAFIPLFIANDHEEVGSATATGAAGPMLAELADRILAAAGVAAPDRHLALARSTCISADGAHGVHPNYPEEHEPGHRPMLNAGPVLKVNANRRYATDAVGQALWARLVDAAREATGADIAEQAFVSANHKPCGSTIGPLTATRLGIRVVDVGAPMLSMHSARELTGARDPWLLTAVLAAWWAGR